MHSARFVTVFALATGVGFAVANCGGSDSTSSTNSGLTCPSNTGTGTCTAEQNKAYGDCVLAKCDSTYQMCLGSGYKSGSFSGPCGSWIGCYAKCNCDKACQQQCGLPPAECQTCLFEKVTPCATSSGCMAPVCTGGGTGGSGGSTGTGGGGGGSTGTGGSGGGGSACTDLMKCCASATNAQIKTACDAQYNTLKAQGGTDTVCTMLAMQYKAAGYCTF